MNFLIIKGLEINDINRMKKAFGIILIIIATILGLGVLLAIPNTILSIFSAFKDNGLYQLGYLLGSLLAITITAVATFFLMRFGIKLLST